MQSWKKQYYTYIQETISHTQRSYVDAHMDEIGMVPTVDPAVFASADLYQHIFSGSDCLNVRSALPMHSHNFLEIIYYASGSNIQYLSGVKRYRLQKGDIVCTPPGVNHRVLRPDTNAEPCRRYLFTCSASFLQNLQRKDVYSLLSEEKDAFILRTSGTKWESLGQLFESCIQENNEQSLYWRQMLTHYANLLLIQLIRARNENLPAPKAEKAGLFEELLAYVDDNLEKRVTLANAAQQFFISQRTLTRIFQENLDISFYRYVTLRRLDTARKLMSQELSMEEICAMVGFSDYPTFYRAFKKEFGISPSQMKKLERDAAQKGGMEMP